MINEENRKVKHRAIEGTGDTIFDAQIIAFL